MKKIIIITFTLLSFVVSAGSVSCTNVKGTYSVNISGDTGAGVIQSPFGEVSFEESMNFKNTVYLSNNNSGVAKTFSLNIQTGYFSMIFKEPIDGKKYMQTTLKCKK